MRSSNFVSFPVAQEVTTRSEAQNAPSQVASITVSAYDQLNAPGNFGLTDKGTASRAVTYGQLQYLAIMWDAAARGVRGLTAGEITNILNKTLEELGYSPVALTTVPTALRAGVQSGVFSEEPLVTASKPKKTARTPLMMMGRRAQKMLYSAAVAPHEVIPQLMGETASRIPGSLKVAALAEFAKALGLLKSNEGTRENSTGRGQSEDFFSSVSLTITGPRNERK